MESVVVRMEYCTQLGQREELESTSVRDLNPPKALPFHDLPVTSWNGRVAISWPAGATPECQNYIVKSIAR